MASTRSARRHWPRARGDSLSAPYALLWLVAASVARADDARVVVVTSGERDPMADRLAADLTNVGLVPVVLVRPPADDGVALDLEAVLAQADSVAAFEVVSSESRVRICVAGQGANPPVRSELEWPAADPVAEAMVGVQAVEILRAGLLQTRSESLGKRADRMSLAELAQAVGRVSAGRSSLWLGSHATVGSLSTGPQADLAMGIHVPVAGRLGVALEVALPVVRARYQGPPGVVHLGVGRVALGAVYGLREPDQGWVPEVGLTVGLTLLGFAYEAGPLFLGRDERRFVRPMAGVRGGLVTPRAGRVGGRFDLRIDGSSPVAVQLEQRPVGTWGPLSLGAGLAVDVLL